MYKLTQHNSIQRLADNAIIPADAGNRDYQEYLEWVDAGNTPEPAEPLPNPRIAEIQLRLLKIDQESVRALRGQAVRGRPADITKLTKLEDEADTLRSELIGL
jgi:hypothetical protein